MPGRQLSHERTELRRQPRSGPPHEVAREDVTDRAAEHGPGLEIHACDVAPPIADLALASHDGHTAGGRIPADVMLHRRGIGSGLGAVARLGDRLLQVPQGDGKCLVVTRFLARPLRSPPA